jgi:hypothetical protein
MEEAMLRSSFFRLVGLALALPLAACAAYQAQHGSAEPPPAAALPETAPVSVRPSGEFSELRPDLQIARVKGELDEIKDNLSHEGRYSCCVDPPCTECLFKYGQCLCREMVRQGRAACGECNQGWIDGRGIVEGVDARELLERSKKLLDPAEGETSGQEKPPEHQHQHH